MAQLTDDVLAELGREVACMIVGEDKFAQVEVLPGLDWKDGPIYYFLFELEPDPAFPVPERIKRIGETLRDELRMRGDDTIPYIRILHVRD